MLGLLILPAEGGFGECFFKVESCRNLAGSPVHSLPTFQRPIQRIKSPHGAPILQAGPFALRRSLRSRWCQFAMPRL